MRALPDDDPRIRVGMYTVSEAARYLGLPISTLQSWVHPGAGRWPLVTSVPHKGYEASVPFIGLAEAFVLQAARRAGVPRSRIRPGVEAVKAELGVAHALASRLLYTDGAELLVRYAADDADLEVARNHQRQLTATVKDQLKLITYAGDGFAQRLRLPTFDETEVIVDPTVAFGDPVMRRTGVRIKDVLDRFWAGESVNSLATDFELESKAVEAIIRAQTRPSA